MIETKIWEAVEGNPGTKRCTGYRSVEDVFNELSEVLQATGLLPDDYFTLDSDFAEYTEFPELLDMCCYAQWKNSEGIYLYAVAVVRNERLSVNEHRIFAVGKTLSEDTAGYDRMQYIAGCIYKLFMGKGFLPARYMLIPQEKISGKRKLMTKLEQEYYEMAVRMLFGKNEINAKTLSEFSLKGKILSVLPDCLLPDDKITELLKEENALNTLYGLCQSINESDAFEINDMISSCRSFADRIVPVNGEERRGGE